MIHSLARLLLADEREDDRARIATFEAREKILRAELADARFGLLIARAIHHDCLPRAEAVRLAHRAEQAELQREQARDHAVHVATACTCGEAS